MERHQKNSSFHDYTIATPPPCFNPVPCYDCCTANTLELTAEASNETSDVSVRNEMVHERMWRSFKRRMNEIQTVVDGKWGTDDKCPFQDPSRPGCPPVPRPLAHSVPACHGHLQMPWHGCMVSAVSHGAVVGPTCRVGPRAVPAWRVGGWPCRQGGWAGGYRKKPKGKENSNEVGHVLPDRHCQRLE
jgi:hypothetical protein